MRPHTIGSCIVALTLTALAVSTAGDAAAQEVMEERKAAHTAAANEAVAWAGHTAELVNIGLTAREYTIVTVAMFEAANAVTQRYVPYVLRLTSEANTSIDAAVATAAHHSLSIVWPRDRRVWDALYELSMSRVGDATAKAAGIRLGKSAAEGILALRSEDVPFPGPKDEPRLGPGVWRPEEPELTPAQAGRYAPLLGLPPITAYLHWKPWSLDTRAQFRPGPPPNLDSDEYAKDLNEVKTLGRFDSAQRTADQTAEALFFMTPAPRIFGPLANQIASARGLDVTDSSRLQALLAIALTDSQIACWDAKFAYRQWRPLSAIHEAAGDSNSATDPDQSWIPLVPTPPFPDYPGAHSCSAGAATAVLAGFIRSGEPLVVTSPATGIPAGSGQTRRYHTLEALKKGVSNARVFAGVHFRKSNEVGADIGAKVGRWVLQRSLKPTKPS